jgi:hypothetical protein
MQSGYIIDSVFPFVMLKAFTSGGELSAAKKSITHLRGQVLLRLIQFFTILFYCHQTTVRNRPLPQLRCSLVRGQHIRIPIFTNPVLGIRIEPRPGTDLDDTPAQVITESCLAKTGAALVKKPG